MGNPILLIQNAGFGETPVPEDALFQPGERVNMSRTDRANEAMMLTVVAVCPWGTPIEYAMADQAQPKLPRPLMLEDRRRRMKKGETYYVFLFDGEDEVRLYPHSAIEAGMRAAERLNAKIED